MKTSAPVDVDVAQARPPSLLVPCLAGAAQSMILINHAPLIPLIVRDLGISPAEAGLLTTAVFITGSLLAVPVGGLTDRLGARRVMSVSLLLFGACTLALALAPGYATLFAVRAVSGAGAAAMFVAGGAYMNALWTGSRQYLAQGLFGGSIQLGIGAAIFVLPGLATWLGWRPALALCALPVGAAWLVWQVAAREQRVAGRRGRIRAVLADGTIRRLALAHAAMFGLSGILGTWVTVYFVRELGLPLALAGMVGSLSVLLGLVGRPLGGLLVGGGRVEPRRLILLTLAASCLALVLLALPGRPLGVAVAGVVVVGLSSSLAYAAAITLAGRAQPTAAGAAIGLLGMASMAAIVVGAPVIGILLSLAGGFALPFLVLLLLPLGALAACLGLEQS